MMKDQMTLAEFRSYCKGIDSIKTAPKSIRITKPSPEKQHIEMVLKSIGVPYVREYQFVPDRKFKADWALPAAKILIEYEGLVFNTNRKSSTGQSGHTSIEGYVSNCEKYNFATLLGFRLLRYTAKTYKSVDSDLRQLLLFHVK